MPKSLPRDFTIRYRSSRSLLSCTARATRRETAPEPRPLVAAVPTDFDFRLETRRTTQALVSESFPSLRPLAESGVLVAIPRRENYVERRKDGYRVSEQAHVKTAKSSLCIEPDEEPELVFLVGTMHISPVSAEAVRQVIECIKPDNVVVELCRTRSGAMYVEEGLEPARVSSERDPAANLRLSSLQKSVQEALKSGSLAGLIIRLLADNLSARMQVQAGVRAGIEMRAARKAAEEAGSQLVLGDRPIEISLERAWDALTFRRKWQLIFNSISLMTQPLPTLDPRDIKRLENDDAVEMLIAKLTAEYPEVASALLHERDLYLAWSLKRSKAVNGCKTVVGVVGRGHVRGVVYHLTQESNSLRFRDLVQTRSRVRQEKAGSVPGWVSVLASNIALAAGLKALWQSAHHSASLL